MLPPQQSVRGLLGGAPSSGLISTSTSHTRLEGVRYVSPCAAVRRQARLKEAGCWRRWKIASGNSLDELARRLLDRLHLSPLPIVDSRAIPSTPVRTSQLGVRETRDKLEIEIRRGHRHPWACLGTGAADHARRTSTATGSGIKRGDPHQKNAIIEAALRNAPHLGVFGSPQTRLANTSGNFELLFFDRNFPLEMRLSPMGKWSEGRAVKALSSCPGLALGRSISKSFCRSQNDRYPSLKL
jgi:hypothetical protein